MEPNQRILTLLQEAAAAKARRAAVSGNHEVGHGASLTGGGGGEGWASVANHVEGAGRIE